MMKTKLSILIIAILLLASKSYSQDSLRTKNDKPGTPQSLRSSDRTPESHVQIINPNAVPGQTNINNPSESNNVNNSSQQSVSTDPNTAIKPNPANPSTLTINPADTSSTKTNSSAIQNGVSNASKPLRNK